MSPYPASGSAESSATRSLTGSAGRIDPDYTACVSFVVPVRNDAGRLEKCLQSIMRNIPSVQEQVEIIVMDNGSQDDTLGVARALGAKVVELPGSPVSRLRNVGVAHSRGDVVAFVDADHELGDQWLTAAVRGLKQLDRGAVGAPYHPPDICTWVQSIYDRFRPHSTEPVEVEWLGSGNVVVRRSAFLEVGGFDETLVACEDVDLCRRLRCAGYRIVNDPSLASTHWGDPASLRALFIGELWRGRGNVRVTLRSPRSWRSIVSLGISSFTLVGLAVLLGGLIAGSLFVSSIGFATVGGLTAARAFVLAARGRSSSRVVVQALAVAAVYNVARACALVWRAPHHRAATIERRAVRDVPP